MAWLEREPDHDRPWTPPPDDPQNIPCLEFRPLKCPRCRSTHVPYYSRRGRVRYHRCRECRTTFKTIELDD